MKRGTVKRVATKVGRRIRDIFGHHHHTHVHEPVLPILPSLPPSTSPASPTSESSSVTLPSSDNPVSNVQGAGEVATGTLSDSDAASSLDAPLESSLLSDSAEESLVASLGPKDTLPTIVVVAEEEITKVLEPPPVGDSLDLVKSKDLDSKLSVQPAMTPPSNDLAIDDDSDPAAPPAYEPALSETQDNMEDSLSDVASPPPHNVEPDPDSFLIDDPEDPMSDDEETTPVTASHAIHAHPSEQSLASAEISLAQSQPPPDEASSPLSSPNIYKDVPPPPPPESTDEEEEAPELYLPGLTIPTMFLPIPNTDSLTTLLAKYIFPPEQRPVRDLTGDWQHNDLNTLVMTNSWRALARMARDRIVVAKPDDLPFILSLWYLRLACLARLRLFNQTSAECTNLFVVLNAVEPISAREYLFDRLLPFELEVLHARLKYWAADHMAYLDALNTLLRRCKTKARAASQSDVASLAMWKERGARLCLMIASQLTEMKDFSGAAVFLEPLCTQQFGAASSSSSSPALRSAIARIYLQGGNMDMAAKHFAVVADDPNADPTLKDMNAALMAGADGDWIHAADVLKRIVDEDAENYVAINNLSVALLSQGKLSEGIATLESALKTSPSSVVVAEPFLFNLSTLYELHSATAAEKKRALLVEVAKWSGDGLRTTCLKMPTT